ncbi:MAG: type II toxin-antitoxin system HicB family antitoxin [Acidobacteriaceae bacterium]|nr:type II toxin-antitoxin system HicB family antitoxin [Acidobacteriaceae bacterium]
MKNFMEYKGYQGAVHYSDEDQIFFGKVMFIRPLLSYEGSDVTSLREAFHQAIDDYLELCEQQGKPPDMPFKGTFNVRTKPELHRRIVTYAEEHDTTLNSVVTQALERYLAQR